jgi:glycosyltransferase involved in cell wall biosynthesis
LPRFSLIVATVDRVVELETLLASLRAQEFKDFEVIIVDQNYDDRVIRAVKFFESDLDLRLIRSSIRNNSHARNLGMNFAKGEIFAFPDDDCVYPADTLKRVQEYFVADGRLAFLTGPSLAHEGHLGPGRWQTQSGRINMFTVWTSLTEFNFFIRSEWARRIDGFDEAFGLGARFGSAEGIEMALRVLEAGGAGYYDYNLRINHIDRGLIPFTVERAFRYGTGLGQALRKHDAPARVITVFMIRPIGGILLNIARWRMVGVSYHWQTFLGRLYGFLASEDDSLAHAARLKSTTL